MRKIVSGGQTGADQGGLGAAVLLGLESGGWVPAGWRTDEGPAPWLRELGLREHASIGYAPRTRANVALADATIIFGNPNSPGCTLTRTVAAQAGQPYFLQAWPGALDIAGFRQWLLAHEVEVLNVAGNRERLNPGIRSACREFLCATLRRGG